MTAERRFLNLNVYLRNSGYHEAAWRVSGADPAQVHYNLALTYHNRGDLLKAKKKPHEAEKAYCKAIELREDLVSRVPHNVRNRKYLIRVQTALGHLLFFTGRRKDAIALCANIRAYSSLPTIPASPPWDAFSANTVWMSFRSF